VNIHWKVVVGCFCLAIMIVLAAPANASGVAFPASSLSVQVCGEGLTETIGQVVLQATGPGTIPAGSSVTLVYSGAISNASSFTGSSAAGLACSIASLSFSCGSGATYLASSASGPQFTVQFNSAVTFGAGDSLEIYGARMNVNGLGSQATAVTATLSATSSAPTTNPITFTDSQVFVGSIVNPSVRASFPVAASAIGTCAVPVGQGALNGAGNGFSVAVAENYPAAITSLSDESAFSPLGTISNGSLVNVVISNVPAGLAVQANGYTAAVNGSTVTGGTGAFGSPAGASGSYTLSLSRSTPAFQVSTGSALTYTFSVTNDSTSAIEKFTVQFGIGLPNGGNTGLSSSVGSISALGTTVSVTAVASLAPSSGVVSFGTNNEGSATVATVGDCAPVPTLGAISPNIVSVSSGSFGLTAFGTGFGQSSSLQWNGSATGITTTVVGSTQLTATIPASLLTIAGTASVTINNASPGRGNVATAHVHHR
jgi:trimeric autotransporter adhesin